MTKTKARGPVHLGCGLIGIGRQWGYKQTDIPDEKSAISFLEFAFNAGIRYFDTAPAYGLSEQRLGKFLNSLCRSDRAKVTIATKVGEHWDFKLRRTYVDHSYEALRRSLDRSLEYLGTIDVLQLHKSSPKVLISEDVQKGWVYAHSLGITRFGVSVSSDDIETLKMAYANDIYNVVQIPYNVSDDAFADLLDQSLEFQKFMVINRPFNMGKTLYQAEAVSLEDLQTMAYRHILDRNFKGIILTGTKSRLHLQENIQAFSVAKAGLEVVSKS